ncbi:MAG: Crp/Fnr family transcriptional regulator [Chloroflexi bacterium]|nr:Crp/Fnr family transcriptional regulator [Chloroflexota bacterium]
MYPPGRQILAPGHPGGGVFAVVEGEVRVYRLSAEGEDATVAVLTAGEIFGLAFLSPAVESRSGLEAAGDSCVVYRFAPDRFRRFVLSHPGAARSALELMAERLAEITERVAELSLFDVTARLAHELGRLALTRRDGLIAATHGELAQRVGTMRDRVTRILPRYRRLGLIEYRRHGRTIRVLDAERLLNWGNEVA